MYDFFDPRFDNSIPDEHGRMPDFNPGNLLLADIDQGDHTIPIFTRFFRRTATPRECDLRTRSSVQLWDWLMRTLRIWVLCIVHTISR